MNADERRLKGEIRVNRQDAKSAKKKELEKRATDEIRWTQMKSREGQRTTSFLHLCPSDFICGDNSSLRLPWRSWRLGGSISSVCFIGGYSISTAMGK